MAQKISFRNVLIILLREWESIFQGLSKELIKSDSMGRSMNLIVMSADQLETREFILTRLNRKSTFDIALAFV